MPRHKSKKSKPRVKNEPAPKVDESPPEILTASIPALLAQTPAETPRSPAIEVSADELVKPLAAGMPEATDSPAGSQPAGSQPDAPPAGSETRRIDSGGFAFDPEHHAVDENGHPRTDVNGRFYSNRAGRPRKAGETDSDAAKQARRERDRARRERERANRPPEFADIPGGESTSGNGAGVPAVPADRYDAAAELYCRTFYGVASGVFGDEGWQPDSEAEHAGLKTAAANYLRSTGKDDLPPGVVLSFAVVAYAGPRVMRPKTSERIGILWHRAKRWLGIGSTKLPEVKQEGSTP